jgi:hypothetical protein
MDENKLEVLFVRKYHDFMQQASTAYELGEKWISWCDLHKIRIMMATEVIEYWNDPGVKGICIENSEGEGWLLVPRTFAKKALVLKGLP